MPHRTWLHRYSYHPQAGDVKNIIYLAFKNYEYPIRADDLRLAQAGDPENSLLIQIQNGEQAHFGQLNFEELELVKEWICAGAP